MAELSPDTAAKARKIETIILQRLAERKATAVAAEAGCHESTISRFKSERLSELAIILAALNLKVVSEDSQTVDYEHRRALMLFAKDYLEAELARDEINSKRDE